MKVGLRREDALCLSKLSVSVNRIAAGLNANPTTLTCWGCDQIYNIGLSLSLLP